MSKSMDTICVHGKEHAVKDQNYAISYPIYQTASFSHLTPYFQNPLSLGADVVIRSGTKYLSGHNDTICGFLCSKDQKLAQHFRLISKTTGGTLATFESWLCLRGLKTLGTSDGAPSEQCPGSSRVAEKAGLCGKCRNCVNFFKLFQKYR